MPAPPQPPRAAIRATLAARQALLRLADRLVPSELAVFEQSMGAAVVRMLGAVIELGVADELARGPATAAQLAGRLGLDADALHRVLRALAARGFYRLDRRGRFRATRRGRLLARDGDGMGAWVSYLNLDSTRAAWDGVGDTVRTGVPAFPAVHGASVWTWFAEHPDEERLFAAAMRRMTRIVLPMVVAGWPWPEEGRLCDVAGGVGTLLAAILEQRPRLQGVLVDAPGVLREAEAHLTGAGVRDRVELAEGDIFARVDARADTYILKDVLHDWDDERCLRILRTVRAAMPAGARLVLVETLIEPGDADPVASLIDVQMLTQCDGGRQRSAAELRALLGAAGLTPGRVRDTGTVAMVEGVAGVAG